MRHQYTIDPEIAALLPPLGDEERLTLRGLLVTGKHCDALVVLHIDNENKNVLGDGHNREGICHEEGMDFPTRLVHVPDRPAAIQWVITNQLGRRNLTDERRSYYRGKKYLNRIDSQNSGLGQNVPTSTREIAEEIAEEQGVSERTIRRDAAYAEAVDALPPDQKETVLNGQGPPKSKVVKPPILCQRCKTIGQETPPTGCTKCAAARAAAKEEEKTAEKERKKKKAEQAAQPTETLDAFKNPVPKKRLPAWSDPWIQEAFDTLAVCLDQLLKARLAAGMDKRRKHYPFFDAKDFIDGYGFATNYIEQLIDHLRDNRPAGVCPSCEGVGCGDCRNAGLVPRETYKALKVRAKEAAK